MNHRVARKIVKQVEANPVVWYGRYARPTLEVAFRQLGRQVPEPVIVSHTTVIPPGAPVVQEAVTSDLTGLTVAQLRDLAKERGLTGISTLRKAELLERLGVKP